MDEAFYQAVLEHAPLGAIVASTEVGGRCHYLNPEFTAITGYELADIPTVTEWIRRAYPDSTYRRRILDNWPADTEPEQMNRDVVYRITCRDGATKQVQFRAGLLGPKQMIVMLLDVTERQATEQALRDSEERYRQLVETSPFGIVLHRGAQIDFANRAALSIIGAESSAQLVGRPVLDFVHPDSVAAASRTMEVVRDRGIAPGPAEQRFVRLDGEVIDVEVHGALVPHRGELAIQVTFLDISQRKRLQRERRKLDRRMRRAQRTESLALLAGGVAHDLNNLLVGILGRADLARRAAQDPVTLDGHLQGVIEAAESAAELVGQLLAYAGRRQLSVQAIDLAGLVRKMEGLLRSTVSQRADLHLDLGAEQSVIEGDPVELRQVLLNLVANAAEAQQGRPGAIRIRVGTVAAGEPVLTAAFAPRDPPSSDCVSLEVIDDGAGMDEPTRERVFDPFFTTKAPGRGLGLASAQGIVLAHRGAITVWSKPEEGTAFRLYLPTTSAEPASAGPAQPTGPSDWSGEGRVLLVDDEPLVVDVAAAMLEQAGFDVVRATSGQAALDLLGADRSAIGCVLLDLTMPGLSGAETLARIRASCADLPVVLSSGYDEGDMAEPLRRLGPAGFLAKPYNYERLVRTIRRALER